MCKDWVILTYSFSGLGLKVFKVGLGNEGIELCKVWQERLTGFFETAAYFAKNATRLLPVYF